MTTLKGAYQRFVTSLIRLWKGQEEEEQQQENESQQQSSSEVDDVQETGKDSEPSTSEAAENTDNLDLQEALTSIPSPSTLSLKDQLSIKIYPDLNSNSENDISRFRASSDNTGSSSAVKDTSSEIFLDVPRVSRNLSDGNLYSINPPQQGRKNSSPEIKRGLSTTNLNSTPSSPSLRRFLRRELTTSNLYSETQKTPPQGARLPRKARPKSVSEYLTPEPRPEKSKLKKSPTFLRLSPSVFRKSQIKGSTDSSDQGTKNAGIQRIPTINLSRLSRYASKKIDGTLKRRPKIKRVIMDDIQVGGNKTMAAESFLARLRDYNTYFDDKPTLQFKLKQDKSGNIVVDGMLNIYWGLKRSIRLQMADSGVKMRPRTQLGFGESDAIKKFDDIMTTEPINEENVNIVSTEQTLTGTILRKKIDKAKESMINDAGGQITINIENGILGDTRHRSYDRRRMALRLKNGAEKIHVPQEDPKNGQIRQKSVILRKRTSSKSAMKRFSINGHAYNYQTSVFTPAYGSVTNVRATSKTSCEDVIKHLLSKFRVENPPTEFSLFVVKETEERRELSRSEFPLVTRVLSGPNEKVCKIFVMDRHMHDDITSEVAQYIKLDLNILQMFVKKFTEEEEREAAKMKERYEMYRTMLKKRIEEFTEKEG